MKKKPCQLEPMDLYFATGPFHVFNILNLKLHENRGTAGALVVVNIFSGAEQLANSISCAGVFHEVYLLEKADYDLLVSSCPSSRCKFIHAMQVLLPLYNQRRYARFPFAHRQYRHIYMASFLSAFATFAVGALKHNRTKLFYFDDGMGARIFGDIFRTGPKWAIKKRLGFFWQMGHVSGRYFYSPELALGYYNYPVLQQIRPDCNSSYDRAMIEKSFSYDAGQDCMKDHTFFYLHGGFEKYDRLCEYAQTDLELAAITCKSVQHAIIFAHPSSSETFDGAPCAPKNRPAFEVSCMLQDIEQKVFVTAFSAAAFNPKFVFDKEPYVILTYKLFKSGLLEKMTFLDQVHQENVLHRMLFDIYRDKSKIFVPSTKEEFLSALRQIANRIAA